jgi:hypothetical protein
MFYVGIKNALACRAFFDLARELLDCGELDWIYRWNINTVTTGFEVCEEDLRERRNEIHGRGELNYTYPHVVMNTKACL